MLIAQCMAEKSGTLLLRPSFGHPVLCLVQWAIETEHCTSSSCITRWPTPCPSRQTTRHRLHHRMRPSQILKIVRYVLYNKNTSLRACLASLPRATVIKYRTDSKLYGYALLSHTSTACSAHLKRSLSSIINHPLPPCVYWMTTLPSLPLTIPSVIIQTDHCKYSRVVLP